MTIYPTTETIPENPADRRGWVTWQLRRRGSSLRKLAAQEGTSQQALSNALMTSSSHLERVIADALGLTVQQLFPERFDEQGNRLGWTRPQQRSTRPADRNVQDGVAA